MRTLIILETAEELLDVLEGSPAMYLVVTENVAYLSGEGSLGYQSDVHPEDLIVEMAKRLGIDIHLT